MENCQYYVRVMAYDQDQRIRKDHYLNNDDNKDETKFKQYIDDRMNVGLNPEYKCIESMETILMQKDDKCNIIDFKGSEIAIISSFQQLFDLYLTVSTHKDLSQWIWLKHWNIMTLEEKLEKYEKYLSHELHSFLIKQRQRFL